MITAIVQARMGSTRLPGKVLEIIAGKPMLEHVVERLGRSETVAKIVVATSSEPEDGQIEAQCVRLGIACFRGSKDDVLDRYYRTAESCQADPIVRITADCPLIDPRVVDRVVRTFIEGENDYVSNIHPPTYPDGLDVEVLSSAALTRAWREAKLKSEREHVTLFIPNHPELFRMANVISGRDLSGLRWVVDEPPDLAFVRAVYTHLGDAHFGMDEVIRLLCDHPELAQLNGNIMRNEGLIKCLEQDSTNDASARK